MLKILDHNNLNKSCYSKMPAPAPAPAAENGAPRTELQELQLRATQVTDEVCFNCLLIIYYI